MQQPRLKYLRTLFVGFALVTNIGLSCLRAESLSGSVGRSESTTNLITNADFDDGPWAFNVIRGSGRTYVSEETGFKNSPSLMLVGETPDSFIQAMSAEIAVSGGDQLQLDFAYRLAYGSGTVDVRWDGGGYVISLQKPTGQWTSFSQELGGRDKNLSGIRYTQGLGSPRGREPVRDSILTMPAGITSVRIYITLRGQGLLAVDALRLLPVSRSAVTNPAGYTLQSRTTLDAINSDELSRLLISKKEQSSQLELTRKTESEYSLNIQDVQLSESYEQDVDSWPPSASNLRVHNGKIVRTTDLDRPIFVMGFESTVVYPWLYQLLGADFVHFQDICSTAVIRSRKTGNQVDVWWEHYKWFEAQLRRVLSAGLAAHVQPYEELQDVFPGERMPFYKEFPWLYANRSHFVNYRFEEPEGQRLRENMWRSVLDITRRYPIFTYELFNEVRYMDYSPANLAGFRDAMQAKYESIEKANEAWGTDFEGFSTMLPPVKSNSAGGTRIGLSPIDFSIPLWIDWQKYIEHVFSNHLQDLASFIRSVDHSPHYSLTVQSTCDLSQGYSGGNGVYPPLKILAENVYGAEGGGGAYISQVGGDNFDEIRLMMRGDVVGRLTSFVANDKPLLDIEVAMMGYGRSPVPESQVVDLAGTWVFRADNERAGNDEGFAEPDYDDSGWASIVVPGLWGAQGFADCSFGWYRTEFSLPAQKNKSDKPLSIYLNGSKLTDYANLYVNGQRVHHTGSWNERFAVDITDYLRTEPGAINTLAVSIENKYQDAGMFWGGIRDYLTLDDRPYSARVPLTAGQMRSYLWRKVVSGCDGLVPSYAYTPEGDHLSMFNPEKVSAEALRAMPLVKNEINEIGDIVLRENRRIEPVGLLYSFESGRGRIPESYEDWVRASALDDFTNWYAALRFSNVPLNVIYNEAILNGRSDAQQVIMLRMAERVLGGTVEYLENYVRDGGVVVIDHGSAMINDDRHTPINLRNLAGIEVGKPMLKPEMVNSGPALPASVQTIERMYDGHTGREVTVHGASVILSYEDGSPALTRYSLGRGHVYYLAAELPQEALRDLLTYIVADAAADAPQHIAVFPVEGAVQGHYVEASLYGGEQDSAMLAYVHNWGDDADVLLQFPLLADGDWRVRQILVGESPIEQMITGSKLRDGIPLRVACQDPMLLLIEPATDSGRELRSLPQQQLDWISELIPDAAEPGAPKILFNASRAETMSPIRMLTAMRLLREAGYGTAVGLKDIGNQVHAYDGAIEIDELADYAVFVTLGNATGKRRFTDAEIKVLREYVENGGGLLIAANQQVGPHGWLDNASGKGPLARAFGMETTWRNIDDSVHGADGIAMHPVLLPDTEAVGHPLLDGVEKVQSLGSSVVDPGKDGVVILRSTDAAKPANAPVAVALEFGKGRVVLLGDAKWMQPEFLEQADNARFLLNLMTWLSHRDSTPVAVTDIQTTIDSRLD